MSGISTISGAVLAVVTRGDRLLLVQRRNPPDQGLWGFPGGRIHAGESFMDAAERELREETGVVTRAEGPLTAFDLIERDAAGALRFHYLIVAVKCTDPGTHTLKAGDDACDAGWFDISHVRDNPQLMSNGLLELGQLALSSRGVIPWPHTTQHRGYRQVPATTEGYRHMTQHTRRVLVVEDEEMIANLLLTVIEASGPQVSSCASVASAMDTLAQGTFDAALVDLTLPDGTPDGVIAALRAKNVPVIVISGDPDRLGRHPDLPGLSKPFRMKTLMAQLEACLAEGMPAAPS